MVRNLAGLKRSAQSRSDGAMSRATAAIRKMQSEEVEINFRSVATQAGVSTAWLYRTKSLRDKIMKARTTSPTVAGEKFRSIRQRLLSGTSRRNSATPNQDTGGPQQRTDGATRSRLRTTCRGCSEGKVRTSFTCRRRADPYQQKENA